MRAAALAILGVASTCGACARPSGRSTAPSGSAGVACAPPGMAIDRYTLDNGLTVVLSEDHARPAVAVLLAYAVGSREDPVGKPGLAHLFEHLVFEGTDALGARDAARLLADAGLSIENGTTALDATRYYEQVAPRGLALALWMNADRMASVGASLTDEKLERVRAIVKRERLERVESSTASLAWVELQRALYGRRHPYGRVYDASPEALDAITLDDARAFYRTHYTPDVATLVVTGDFDAQEAKASIAAYYGKIPRGKAVAASPTKLAPPPLERGVRIAINASIVQRFVVFGWITPQVRAPGDTALDGLLGLSDPLEAKLRRRGLALDVSLSHASHALGSELIVKVTPADGVTAREIERALLDELEGLDGPIYERALAAWERRVESEELQSFETPLGHAGQLASGMASEGDPWTFVADCAQWRSLSLEDVRKAVAKYVLARPHVMVTVNADPKAPLQGEVISREGNW